jgi:exodeoxyribonuclease VII large subunit
MRQRLEDRGERLGLAVPTLLDRKRATLNRLAPRLPHPREQIAARRAALAMLGARATAGWQRTEARRHAAPPLARFAAAPVQALVREKRTRLEGLVARLEGVSYQAVLSRGFALVQDAEGAPLTTAAAVPPGASLNLTFADGSIGATADGPRPARRRPRDEPPPDEPPQGALL